MAKRRAANSFTASKADDLTPRQLIGLYQWPLQKPGFYGLGTKWCEVAEVQDASAFF